MFCYRTVDTGLEAAFSKNLAPACNSGQWDPTGRGSAGGNFLGGLVILLVHLLPVDPCVVYCRGSSGLRLCHLRVLLVAPLEA